MHVSQLEINSPNNYPINNLVGLKDKLLSMDVDDSLQFSIITNKHFLFLRTINSIASKLYIRHNTIYSTSFYNDTFTITRNY